MDREFRHWLRQCHALSHTEYRLLGFVSSFSDGALMKYEKICTMTSMSRSTLNRTIKSLLEKKLIEITHRAYKKTCIKIVRASEQKAYAKANDVPPAAHQSCAAHDTMMCHQRHDIVPPAAHSMLEKPLERKLESNLIEGEKKYTKKELDEMMRHYDPNWAKPGTENVDNETNELSD